MLLLDEPLGALDLKLRRQMQDELKALQKRVGTAFVHVTHDQEEAMALADHVRGDERRAASRTRGRRSASISRPAHAASPPTFMGESTLLSGKVQDLGIDEIAIDTAGRPGRRSRQPASRASTWRWRSARSISRSSPGAGVRLARRSQGRRRRVPGQLQARARPSRSKHPSVTFIAKLPLEPAGRGRRHRRAALRAPTDMILLSR